MSAGVVRTRCGLRVVLHAEHGKVAVPQPFDRAVVQGDVRCLARVRGLDGEAVGSDAARSELDVLLSHAFLTYAWNLWTGRVDPVAVNRNHYRATSGTMT